MWQNQANTTVKLMLKCFCQGTSPAEPGWNDIYWTILYQFKGPLMCSIHVHVVLCHFQTSSMKLLSICWLVMSCFLELITITALLLEIQLSWFYKKCSHFCKYMKWIELNFCYSTWLCCSMFLWMQWSTLTAIKKSFHHWNVAGNSS